MREGNREDEYRGIYNLVDFPKWLCFYVKRDSISNTLNQPLLPWILSCPLLLFREKSKAFLLLTWLCGLFGVFYLCANVEDGCFLRNVCCVILCIFLFTRFNRSVYCSYLVEKDAHISAKATIQPVLTVLIFLLDLFVSRGIKESRLK